MNNLGTINILLLILTGCFGLSIPESPELDALINTSAKSVVHLNSVKSKQITPNLVVAGKKDELDEYLARPVSSVLTKKYILTADQGLSNIAVSNQQGDIMYKFGKEGRGPGEFRYIKNIATNNKYIFVSDLGNQRMQVYNHNLDLVETINISIPLDGKMSVSNKYIFLPAAKKDEHMLTIHSSQPPFNKLFGFLPVVIQNNMQPRGYNVIKSATNTSGYVLFSYPALPYLFLFNPDLKHLHTIELEDEIISEIMSKNPEPEPVKYIEDPMIRNIIGPLAIDDNLNLYFGIGRTLYILKKVGKQYKIRHSYQFDASGYNERYNKPLGLYDLFVTPKGKYVYHTSIHHGQIFRFKME